MGRGGGHEGRFSKDPLPVFSAGGQREQLRPRQECRLFKKKKKKKNTIIIIIMIIIRMKN